MTHKYLVKIFTKYLQTGFEIESEKERLKRHLPAQSPLKKLEDKSIVPYNFIDYETVVSTSQNQTTIGIGDLIGKWKKGDRNYFHYKSYNLLVAE